MDIFTTSTLLITYCDSGWVKFSHYIEYTNLVTGAYFPTTGTHLLNQTPWLHECNSGFGSDDAVYGNKLRNHNSLGRERPSSLYNSHPMHRMRFSQYQASSAALGWPALHVMHMQHRWLALGLHV